MSVRARLRQVEAGSNDPESIADLARDALAEGEEELALPTVVAAMENSADARLWQWAGLLHRGLDDHAAALKCFGTAGQLAPADASIAHGWAHVALEAGVDAEALFERALVLAPGSAAVLIGRSAARMAAGHGARALTELEEILDAEPRWIDGHVQYAQLSALLGRRSAASASLKRAVGRLKGEEALWLALCDLSLRSEAYDEMAEVIARASAAGVAGPRLDFYRAVVAGERRDPDADQRLSEAAARANPDLVTWRLRHLLRTGQIAEALPAIDRALQTDQQPAVWPYASVAWRLAGDRRAAWLEDEARQVSVFDLRDALAPMAALTDRLRALHGRSGQFLDQSVRGGTQTDGPLLSRIDPEIRQLRAAVMGAVGRYMAALPAEDAGHPLLGPPRDRRIRFSGSWSVRLRGRGYHANHVHPLGWISSALHLSAPERQPEDSPDSGWLVLGEPDARLGVDLPAYRRIAPKPGQLVLFPSWMWHGTRPFAEGERLTVAFDIAPPR